MNQKLGFSAAAIVATMIFLIIVIPFAESGAPHIVSSIKGTATAIPPTPTATPIPPTATPVPPTVLLIRPLASGDDAHQNFSGSDFNSITAINVYRSTDAAFRYAGAWRFPSVNIPQGQTVDSASLTLTQKSTGHHMLDGIIRGEDIDDHPGVLTTIWSLTNTTANVVWQEFVYIDTDTAVESPDITAIIQEIVDRPGWVSGNDIVLMVEGLGTGSDMNFVSYSYDNTGTASKHALLTIEFQP